MGGTLTLYMAENYPDIHAIIPINAAVTVPSMENVHELGEVRYLDAIGSDIKDPEVKELAYEKTPVLSVKEILRLMEKVRGDLSKVTCPALIFVSDEDHVVPPANAQLIHDEIGSERKTLYPLKNSYHVATLDYDQRIIIDKTLKFIESTL